MNRTGWLKFLDAAAGPAVCRLLAARSVEQRPPLPQEAIVASLRRLLLIRPGGLGDMIVLLPVLRAIQEQWPHLKMDVLCEQRNADLLKLTALNVSVWEYDRAPLRCVRHLRRAGYDVAIDTEQFHHFSAVLARLSRAPVRIGFNINPRRNPLYTHLVGYDPDGAEREQFARLLAPLGVENAGGDPVGSLRGARLPAVSLPSGEPVPEPYVAVHAGASTPYKQWPPERFAALLAELHRREGLSAVLVGGRADGAVSRTIAATLQAREHRVVNCAGTLTLGQTASLLRHARGFVGSDSGLAHLAMALGIPTVVLFGPSDPAKWGRDDARHAVVRRRVACAPCFLFGYHKPCRHRSCMTAITVEDVLAACHRVLKNP